MKGRTLEIYQQFHQVAAVILVQDNKILLLRRSKFVPSYGFWNFPGGSVESGESIVEAAIRELREESNLEVKPQDLVYLGYTIKDGKLQVHHFITSVFEGELDLNMESDRAAWVSMGQVCTYLFVGTGILHPELQTDIIDFIEGEKCQKNTPKD